MTLVVLAAVAATLLGFAFRGSLARFGRPKLQRRGLLAFAALAQVTAPLAKHPGVYAGWLAGGVLALVVFARVNRGRPGLLLAAAGLLANVVVIVVNWSMPVDLEAADRARVPASRLDLSDDALRSAVDDGTVLPWLGQSIPLALPLWPDVASPGDVLTAAGTAVFLFTGLTGRGRPAPPSTVRGGKRARGRRRVADTAAGSPTVAPTAESATVPVATVFESPRSAAAASSGDNEAGALDPQETLRTRTVPIEAVGEPRTVEPLARAAHPLSSELVEMETTVELVPLGDVAVESAPRSADAAATDQTDAVAAAVTDAGGPASADPQPALAEAGAVTTALGGASPPNVTEHAGAGRTTTRPPGRGAKRSPAPSDARASRRSRRVAGRPGPVVSGSHVAADALSVPTLETEADAARTARKEDRKRTKRQARQQRKSVERAASTQVGPDQPTSGSSSAAGTQVESGQLTSDSGSAVQQSAPSRQSASADAMPAAEDGPPRAWQI